ncbi:MAG: glycosyltransferase family 1 protein [Planctomycetia bacterium]|nr:glycosyltransferase family 1 protein [Planctomycetia bacterium]
MCQKINWLLSNPVEADKIRTAGRIRALKDHTWEKRFENMFRITRLLKED